MSLGIITQANRWHGHLDTERFYQEHAVETLESKYFIVQERDIKYHFFLHQHPYVQELMQRLLRTSTSGLQAADTEYNTRVKLKNATTAKGPNGRSLQLAANEIIYLPDGATATLNGSEIRFVGRKVLRMLDDSSVPIAVDDVVTVHGRTILHRSNGEKGTLDTDASASLIDGMPVPILYSEIFTTTLYKPTGLVETYPIKDLDFRSGGAYAVYNWELFYHVPITIAIHLSRNQRFAEAQRWFHYLFDPTDDSHGPTPERFWKVKPFQYTDVHKIEEILVNLVTGVDENLRNDTVQSIEAWKDTPFRPHVIARSRQQAYMYKAVMAYLDNLIAWGDSLFRQDTGEAIDEALQLYVLAVNILGPQPLPVPRKGIVRPQTYANLQQDLRQFGTVLRNVEAELPFDLFPFPAEVTGDNDRIATIRSLGKALYYCVPQNDRLLSYWVTMADRLFKIRNSLNIQGVFRQLALFEPPIDPAMLARAAAAGVDISAIVNGLNQPLPLVRFSFLVQKATEIVQEVKSLGNNLLAAMEKEDNESLALLRAKHERVVMEMVEHVKYGQLQETIKSREGLLQSLALAVQRYTFYERQLGKKQDEIEKALPELDDLDKDSLAKMSFAMRDPGILLREIEVDIATDAFAQAMQLGQGGKILSSHEVREAFLLEAAQLSSDISNVLSFASSIAHVVPTTEIHVQPWGFGSTIKFGGENVGRGLDGGAAAARAIAERFNFEARRANKIDAFARRERDWAFNSNLAAGEITQIIKQLRGAQIREAIAELELRNHRQQMKHAEEIEHFLNEEGTERTGKKTNRALYTWMKREVKGLYAQSFQFAFDICKKTERALQHELGNTDLNYIHFGYLSGKEGLLAGEKLHFDVKRMEMAYHELNQREYELTKHVSLLQVDPLALIQLRTTGRCTVTLPEVLFDMDGSGHYFRRIKTVAVSIPCVTGPYASINCKLTLQKSSIRKKSAIGDQYSRVDAEDDRFDDYFGSQQSIVVSSAQNDSGLFETNLRDERYLPFENSGVISEWQLELPAFPNEDDPAQFDYNTISDVILHIRYTAREGGKAMRDNAMSNVKELINAAQAVGSVRLFSVRHEFPNEWAKFESQTPANNQRFELRLNLRPEHYPFWSNGRLNSIEDVEIIARSIEDPVLPIDIFEKPETTDNTVKGTLARDMSVGGLLRGPLPDLKLLQSTGTFERKPTGGLELFFNKNAISDLWVVMTWSGIAER